MHELELALYLMGEIPESEELEGIFCVQSSVSHRRGEPRVRASTGEVVGQHLESVWGFSSATAVASDELAPHLAWLLPKATLATRVLSASPNARAFFEIALREGTNTVLPREFVQSASDLNAEVGIIARGRYTL